MMIHKYPVQVEDSFEVRMPAGARVIAVQVQDGDPVMWAVLDENAFDFTRTFRVVGTGQSFDDCHLCKHVGTFQLEGGAFVGHLFEVTS